MAIASKLIRRPVTVFMVFSIVMGFGIFVSSKLGIELLPSVEIPYVLIYTSYPNANPEEIEETITKPIENLIQGIANIKKFTSSSYRGKSSVSIEFEYGTNQQENFNNVREELSKVTNALPDDAHRPELLRFNPQDIPVFTLAVSANRSRNEIRGTLEDVLKPVFEQINGVAYTVIDGGEIPEIYADVDLYKLKEFSLTFSDVKSAVQRSGQRVPVGSIKSGGANTQLLLDTKYSSLNQLKDTLLKKTSETDGTVSYIRLQDVGHVYKGVDSTENQYALLNDKSVVLVSFFKQSGTSIVAVANRIRNSLDMFKQNSPQDFNFEVVDDNSSFIQDNLRNITTSVLFGAVLAILVLIVFLRNFASVLVITIAIPASVIITLMMLFFLGISLNVMTLAGLALGVGMLVDNSIVVLENIYIKRLSGIRLIPASEFGAIEMTRPIFASTLTTVMVFLPMAIFKKELGVEGAFMANLAIVVVVSLLSSFAVAAFVVPVMTSQYIPIHPIKHKGFMKKLDMVFETTLERISVMYDSALRYMIPRRKRFIGGVLLLSLILPVVLFIVGGIKVQLSPAFENTEVYISFDFPKGYTADQMLPIMRDAEKKITPNIPDIDFYILSASSAEDGGAGLGRSNYFAYTGSGQLAYKFSKSKDDVEMAAIRAKLKPLLHSYIGVDSEIFMEQGGGVRAGGSAGRAEVLSMELRADNYQELTDTAQLFENVLNRLPVLLNVQATKPNTSPQYTMDVDTVKAELSGISVSSLANELSDTIGGGTVASFTDGSNERSIIMRLKKSQRESIDIINQIDVRNKDNVLVPITNFFELNQSKAVSYIRRVNGKRAITITADVAPGHTLSSVIPIVTQAVSQVPRNENVSYAFSGDYEELKKQRSLMISILIIAAVFVFGIMASQFESLLDPFIIIFTVPLTMTGVFALYALTGQTLNIFSGVGMVVLIGVAVNHGIVLVDYTNLLRKRGIALMDAVIDASKSRLLPIIMTTGTTVLGLAPTAFIKFQGSELIRPIAITVVGGLTASVFLSLFLIPLLYYSVNNMSDRWRAKRMRKKK